jgi:hypothetical protein
MFPQAATWARPGLTAVESRVGGFAMKVICFWCETEGKPAVVREKKPFDDPDETHGVWAEHEGELRTGNDSS